MYMRKWLAHILYNRKLLTAHNVSINKSNVQTGSHISNLYKIIEYNNQNQSTKNFRWWLTDSKSYGNIGTGNQA